MLGRGHVGIGGDVPLAPVVHRQAAEVPLGGGDRAGHVEQAREALTLLVAALLTIGPLFQHRILLGRPLGGLQGRIELLAGQLQGVLGADVLGPVEQLRQLLLQPDLLLGGERQLGEHPTQVLQQLPLEVEGRLVLLHRIDRHRAIGGGAGEGARGGVRVVLRLGLNPVEQAHHPADGLAQSALPDPSDPRDLLVLEAAELFAELLGQLLSPLLAHCCPSSSAAS